MEWGGCLSPRGCPRCPWDSQGRESTVVNHPIQKLNLSTNLKKEFSNYAIFELDGTAITMASYLPGIFTLRQFLLPTFLCHRETNEFFVRTSFCAQQKCLIHVSRRNVRALMFGSFPARCVCIQLNSRIISLFFLHSNRRRVKEVAVVPSCGACPEKCPAWGLDFITTRSRKRPRKLTAGSPKRS